MAMTNATGNLGGSADSPSLAGRMAHVRSERGSLGATSRHSSGGRLAEEAMNSYLKKTDLRRGARLEDPTVPMTETRNTL